MIVSPESLLEQTPGRFQNRDAVGEAWAASHRAFKAALEDPEILDAGILVGAPGSGKSTWANAREDVDRFILFDAVWAVRHRRIAMASKIRAAGKKAVCVWVQTPLTVCIDRNAERPAWRRVPEPVIRRNFMAIRRDPPRRCEGWHALLKVPGC